MRELTELMKLLCRADPASVRRAMERRWTWTAFCLAVIVTGSGLYGATIGLGRAPLQAAYTAVKFPLLILLTTAGNSILNGMLAQLIGVNLSFARSATAVVTSFAVTSALLASLSPVTLFLWFNTPSFSSPGSTAAHNFTLVLHVFTISFAGLAGNVALYRLLADLSGSPARGGRVLAAWLGGNMFLGCQLSWIMRPFIGSPGLPVAFFRDDAFRGNFYEATFGALINLLT